MMVGQIMSAKTSVVHTLAAALTHTSKEARLNATDPIEKVMVNTINPKSISIGKLYGDFDKVSHDWSDGVLATVIKDCATDKSGNRRWILMDGPVDAVWIENLNTVLDDNKKLCLASGEIVKFTPKMTMMFEVEDLLEASPATVSRCGMVFLNPERLGWNVMVQPWLTRLPQQLRKDGRSEIYRELINLFVPQVIGFLFGFEQTVEEEKRLEGVKSVIQVTKNWSFRSFITFFESLLMKTDTRESLIKKE
jgi:dynein heavy chain